MNEKHCDQCGKLISHGLRYGDMVFCCDECADRFGIDPRDCFAGGVDDTTDYTICDQLDDYQVYHDAL